MKRSKRRLGFFLKPFSFREYISLQINAKLVISDSGSIAEESSILKLNSISLRNTFERQEGLETSSIIISSLNVNNFEKILNYKLSSSNKKSYSIVQVAKLFKSRISYLPKRAGERYTSSLISKNLSNKIYKHYGKIKLEDYIGKFLKNNN